MKLFRRSNNKEEVIFLLPFNTFGVHDIYPKALWDSFPRRKQLQKMFEYERWHHEDMVTQAQQLATVAHRNQTDIAGVPYVEHCKRVADRVAFCGDTVIAVAWLHDVVEDTIVTMDLIREFFPEEVADAVDALTQRKGEPLESYWTRVANNRIAFIVKLHGDMPDNNDPKRWLLTDPHRQIKIGNKYATAIDWFWQHGFAQGNR